MRHPLQMGEETATAAHITLGEAVGQAWLGGNSSARARIQAQR
ncbi:MULTISPECIES: hypothetical protein [unclassified Limnobacter]|nr:MULTISPECIES: hypothetical protein [unclassified Limnobacter]